MTKHTASRLAAAAALGLLLSGPAFAGDIPEWHPESSERLVKLPATYLKKSLEHDFAESALGTALRGTDGEIGFKAKTLQDLQNSIAKAEGDMRIELRHQFLHEKRAYVDMMSKRNELQRSRVRIQTRLLEDMLARMRPGSSGDSPAKQELIKRQDAARARYRDRCRKRRRKLRDGRDER